MGSLVKLRVSMGAFILSSAGGSSEFQTQTCVHPLPFELPSDYRPLCAGILSVCFM